MSTTPEPPARLVDGVRGERDAHGYLVTHVVYRTAEGTPILKLVDTAAAVACMAERRCQSCGFPIDATELLGFIGAPGERVYKEAPIHLDCAHYSFQVCPHLLSHLESADIEIAVCREYRYLGVDSGQGSSRRGIPRCLPCALESGTARRASRMVR